jgi:Fe2+ or Zn2+ uptake regulation protein
MGKKQKKLTEEEIEEYRNGTYQMMAAMSGKTISELIGESPSRPNYDENYCLTKQMYLKNCIEPISSRQLYELLQKQGYKAKYSTFRGLLNNYMKYGYIKKYNSKKPFLYVLTDEGKLHVKNPFLLVDENIRRYHEFQNRKMIDLINNNPEKFKQIYESIIPSANTFSSGSSIGYNNEELNSKIYNNDFWKNANEDEINNLINSVTFGKLSEDETELLIDAITEARNSYKGSMIVNRQYQSNNKPEGLRKYYQILINAVNKPVTKGVYEAIPFVFIFLPSKNELRLESESIAGKYRNNKDAMFIDFDLVNQRYFYNKMQIKTRNNGNELEFYYVVVDGNGVWGFNLTLTVR